MSLRFVSVLCGCVSCMCCSVCAHAQKKNNNNNENLPVQPGRQEQAKPPMVLTHKLPEVEQLWVLVVHSLTSVQVIPLPE